MLEKEMYDKLFTDSFTLPLEVTYWDGSTAHYGASGEPAVRIKLNQMIPPKDILHNASLTLGEAYMDRKLEIEGSIEDLICSAYENAESFLRNTKYRKWMPKLGRHTGGASKKNVSVHYDLGNDFFRLWLDPSLTYSCGYFATPEDSLEMAQQQKVRHILDKLFIQPGESLVDIGCGWGNLIFTAVSEYGAEATGITLSEEQYEYCQSEIKKRGLEGKCQVKLADYRELKGLSFDHVTSVGMFEHVGPENLGTYFQQVAALMKPQGTALIHGISRQQGGATNAWLNQYIFPGGYVPGVAELVSRITECDLQLIDLESLRRDYQLTLEHWTKNFHAVEEQVIKLESDRFYRMWDLYLQACAASFKAGNIDVIQYLLVKPMNNEIPMHRQV